MRSSANTRTSTWRAGVNGAAAFAPGRSCPGWITFSTTRGVASTKPPVPFTGNQYSVHVSDECGSKPRCLNGVDVLASAAWLKRRPDCTSTYWPSVSVSSVSQIIPWRESPQIQAFFPSLSSRVEYRPIPKSSSCQ